MSEQQIGRRPIKGDFMFFYPLSLRNEQKKLPNFQEKFQIFEFEIKSLKF